MTNRDALLVELDREFRKGNITLGHIVADGEHVEGICEGTRIVVDPAPSTIDTLFHEMLHRRYPRWGERRVSKTAEGLVKGMSAADVRRWYKRFSRAAVKASRPINVD